MPAPNVEEVQVPCSLFLGLNTEVAPPDLPEGASPACADVIFVPGSVSSRPCLHKIFSPAFPGNPSVTYQKTFLQPNSDPLNLYMTSDGKFWYEDILSSPGAYTELAQIIAQLYAQSCTASGAEYIAFSDGLKGMDIPRQVYRTPDGTLQFDRVSQDGPGANTITIADFQETLSLVQVGLAFRYPIFSVSAANQTGNLVTMETSVANDYYPGLEVFVQDVGTPTWTLLGSVLVTALPTNFVAGETVKQNVTGVTATLINAPVGSEPMIFSGLSGTPDENNSWVGQSSLTTYIPQNGSIATPPFVNPTQNPGYNGLQTIVSVLSTTEFTYLTDQIGLTSASSGQVSLPIAQAVVPGGQPQLNVGDQIVIAGSGGGLDNGIAIGTSGLNNPATWEVVGFFNAGGGDWGIYFSFGTAPSAVVVTSATTGTVFLGGQSSPGLHQIVVMFLTRSGYLTQPSPPLSFVSAGNTQWQLTGIPIGPPNVVARVFAVTGSGGDNFFTITSSIQFPNPISPDGTKIVIEATVLADNTSTSAIIDTSDNALFGAQAIDIDGNDLFNQVVLGPCLGMFYYASRLVTWGMSNKLENFLGMGFEGGYRSGVLTTPLGWTLGAGITGGILTGGENGFGQAWQITGDGSGNRKGEITQTAFQNTFGIAIVEPSTQYNARFYATASVNASGTLFYGLYSPSLGLMARASIPISQIVADGPGFYEELFSNPLPITIPADAILDIYAIWIPIGETVTIDENEIVPTYDPFFTSFLISYVDNFEAFDGVSGVMGPTADPNPLRGCETLRDQLQFLTTGGMHQTSDNGEEPSGWSVSEISNDTGLAAYRALDSGEECIIFVSKSGGGDGTNPTYALRIFEGGQPWKISQEVQAIFDNINPAAEQTMWLVNDIGERRIYIGVPEGDATAPSQLYVMDYREIDTAYQIAQAASVHISFTGKMIASDLARKWCPWNIAANCGAMLSRSATNVQFCLGAGNGVTPGDEAGFGNVYYLDPAKFTDDDYGVMSPFYTMYFFISRDNETALGVGSMRKLYKRISEFVSGIGNWTLTLYAASLTNPWPSPPSVQLSTSPTEDFYHGVNVSTERMAVKFAITPLAGETDVQFNLQHMEATVMQHPVSPFGTGANL